MRVRNSSKELTNLNKLRDASQIPANIPSLSPRTRNNGIFATHQADFHGEEIYF
jgi:hypothetical protein